MKSFRNLRYYIGSTDNINRRMKEHNLGLAKATSKIRPLILMRFISCQNLNEARRYEYRLKKYKRRDILEKVIEDGIFPWEH